VQAKKKKKKSWLQTSTEKKLGMVVHTYHVSDIRNYKIGHRPGQLGHKARPPK
jgi:hypothetical protein